MEMYYTPEKEDIRIGYQCETQKVIQAWTHSIDFIIRTDLTYDENWELTIIDLPLSGNLSVDHCLELLESEHLRVPYLTKEQIEAEGWVESHSHGVFEKGDFKLGYLGNEDNSPQIWIKCIYHMKYEGDCKSINELRYISKLLKI